jgi:multiple sugar transport system permease protein
MASGLVGPVRKSRVESGRRKLVHRDRAEALAGYLFILPDTLGLLLFVAVPMVFSLSLGFFKIDGFGGYQFVGLANYNRMFRDPLFIQSLWVTLEYVVVLVPALFVSGLGLALLVRRKVPLMGVFRSLFFMPNVVSLVVVALVWQVLLVDRIGFLNRLFQAIGIQPPSWLGDPRFALWAVLLVTVWFLMGYYMIIFLAGLQEIPLEYYDLARIDGASSSSSFIIITLPLLRPTSFFVLLVSLVSAVAGGQGFDLIYIMTRGGPANSTSLGIFYIYQQAFQFNDYGYAAAMASFLVILLLLLTIIFFFLTKGGRFHAT